MVMYVCPSVRPGLHPSFHHSFPHFPPTCFDILSGNFVYGFILMHLRSSSNAINFCQCLQEFCPCWTLKFCKYAVFRTFLLHAWTYWVETLYMTLLSCKSEQVQMLSLAVNFCRSYAPFQLRILQIHSFPHFSPTYFDIFCWNCVYDFLSMNYRSSINDFILLQFL